MYFIYIHGYIYIYTLKYIVEVFSCVYIFPPYSFKWLQSTPIITTTIMAANIYICFNALSALHISIHIILQQSYVINSILCSFLKGGKQDTQIYHNLYTDI